MVWKQPKLHEIQATNEIKENISKSIYYNSDGELVGASLSHIMEILLGYQFLSIAIASLIYFLLNIFIQANAFIILIIVLITVNSVFYIRGFKSYKEMWYYFDDDEELFIITRRNRKGEWEIIDVPYEDVYEIEYIDGLARIEVPGFTFYTNRYFEKRETGLTEIYDKLAKIVAVSDCKMSSWPYYLECPVCKRVFGNHTGTAICPVDKDVIMLDPDKKGDISPQEQLLQDIDRV